MISLFSCHLFFLLLGSEEPHLVQQYPLIYGAPQSTQGYIGGQKDIATLLLHCSYNLEPYCIILGFLIIHPPLYTGHVQLNKPSYLGTHTFL